MEGKIIKIISNSFTVLSDKEYVCNARGKFRNLKITPLVGDNVIFDNDKKIILSIKERKNSLIRPPIANVDQAIIVASVKEPNLDLYLLDKLLCLIEFNNNECILIDTGFKETYYKYLKPLLIELKRIGKKITLLVITHIDKDHIGGARKLLEENGDFYNPSIIKIENIWFNGFKNLIFHKNLSDIINQRQLNKMRIIKANNRMNYFDEIDSNVSANDLKSFEIICNELKYPVNRQFPKNTVIQFENIKVFNVIKK